ncbi:MAG: hypothetical protein JJU45_01920 [Acidimicrobiia bacterium]|nr:hypothetical protein [Acidimicrobiia bacterium]
MQRNGQHTARAAAMEEDLDRILASLPADHLVAHLGVARLCIGHTGAFVIAPSGDSLGEAAATVHSLAEHTRQVLSDHLPWTPFLDALVICGGDDGDHVPAATTVPLDLLASTLCEGPTLVDERVLTAVRHLLRQGRLDGWQAGTPSVDGRIDLCNPPIGQPGT